MYQEFLTWEYSESARELAVTLFFWSGVAIWSGMIARIFIRTRRFQSPWVTFVMGFVGVCLGPIFVRNVLGVDPFDPISPAGLLFSVLATLCCMTMFYILAFMSRNDPADDEFDDDDDRDRYEDEREYDGDPRPRSHRERRRY